MMAWLRILPLVVLFTALNSAQAALLVDLNAFTVLRGATNSWSNQGALGGQLTNSYPLQVEEVQGRVAVVFDGMQRLASDFQLPNSLEKGHPFTVEVWALNLDVEKAETVLALARSSGGPGTEFNFATNASAGAFRFGHKATLAFHQLPAAGVWQHLAWTYSGGIPGEMSVYVNGELDQARSLRVTLPAQLALFVGATGETDSKGPRRGFSGAIAQVRIHDSALSQATLRAAAGLRDAFAPLPQPGSTTDSLAITLKWQPGDSNASSFVVYAGTNRTAVEQGDFAVATRISQPELGPISLSVGSTWFWRVTQVDSAGSPLTKGQTWQFTADPGQASEPQPGHNNGNVGVGLTRLAWRPGKHASQQRVFFSTRPGEIFAPQYLIATVSGTANSCPLPKELVAGARYYWGIESDNGDQPGSRGPVWTFRTQDAPLPNDITFFVATDTHYGRENNAAINRRVIEEMNRLPGTALPAEVGGGWVRTPVGVVLTGDLLDEGFNPETATTDWAEFCRDYGLTGRDGRLYYPVYEGFGNHDGGPKASLVRPGVKERNRRRVGLTSISTNGLHYSWDWDQLHLIQLNLFGGSGPADVKGVSGVNHDPEGAFEFMQESLTQNVGASGRPVIVFQHFGWLGGMSEWWQPEAKQRFYEAVKPFNVVCLINGHSHGADFLPWHDLLTVHAGSTARGEHDTGDFLVVRVTPAELIIIQRKLGEWGIHTRRNLNAVTGSK